MPRLPKKFLRRLRNEIPVADVARLILDLPHKQTDGLLRFLCPVCGEFNTCFHPRENLGRCFRCRKNFNPIDLVMADRGCGFRTAVDVLKPWLSPGREQAQQL